jgi:hypothetical protein
MSPHHALISQSISSFLPLFSLFGPSQHGPYRMHGNRSGSTRILVSQHVQQSRCGGFETNLIVACSMQMRWRRSETDLNTSHAPHQPNVHALIHMHLTESCNGNSKLLACLRAYSGTCFSGSIMVPSTEHDKNPNVLPFSCVF